MPRLIDADALIARLDAMGKQLLKQGTWKEQEHDGLMHPIAFVKDAPAIDAEPVRHGRWEWVRGGFLSQVRCSECGTELSYKGNFCPSCGARMGLELGTEREGAE